MRTCITWVVFLALLGCGQAARAEPPLARVDLNSAPGGGFGNLYLLGQHAVQQDLRLSQGQVEKVRGLLREVVDKQQAWRGEKDPEERRQLAGEAVRVRLRNDGLAAALLTSGQAERLKQISWQYRATASFWDPEVRDALRITDEQFARIKAIGRKDYSAWNREAASAFRKDRDFPAYQRRLAESRSRRDREQAAVLTPEQRAQWERMLGDPFQGPTPGPILVPAVARGPRGERPEPAMGRGAALMPQASLLVGRWRVEFANGVTEACAIGKNGTASVAEPRRTSGGKVTVQDGAVVVVYDDDRVERWTPVGRKAVVEHWYPGSAFPSGRAVLGIARHAR